MTNLETEMLAALRAVLSAYKDYGGGSVSIHRTDFFRCHASIMLEWDFHRKYCGF